GPCSLMAVIRAKAVGQCLRLFRRHRRGNRLKLFVAPVDLYFIGVPIGEWAVFDEGLSFGSHVSMIAFCLLCGRRRPATPTLRERRSGIGRGEAAASNVRVFSWTYGSEGRAARTGVGRRRGRGH